MKRTIGKLLVGFLFTCVIVVCNPIDVKALYDYYLNYGKKKVERRVLTQKRRSESVNYFV